MSVDLGRGTRRFQRFVTLGGAKPSGEPPRPRGILDPDLLRSAIPHAFRKLDPRLLIKNPVMFVVEITAVLVTLIALANVDRRPAGRRRPPALGFQVQIAIWLWFTVLFATYAEAVAEARGRAQAATLRKTRSETTAHRRLADGTLEDVGSSELRKGDIIVVEEGETIPGDGDVIEGVGFVNEAAITGESAPVLKEPGTDIRSSVTGGTTLVSDRLVIRVTTDPGETFLDRMIALVEGAKRQRTPNEIALAILLAGLTIVFLMATVTLRPFGAYAGTTVDTVALVALLVCLIPTTIGGLLSAIGIAGMDRVARFNVLAMSGRAVEASGDVDVILLDKTGTITYGNRLASSITAGPGRHRGRGGHGRPGRLDPRRDAGRPLDRRARPRAPRRARPAGRRGRRRRASPRSARTIAEEIPFRAETRTSGVRTARGGARSSRAPSTRSRPSSTGPCRPSSSPPADGSPTRARRRSRSASDGRVLGRDRAQGHRQGGPRRAVRRVPPDGHPDGDDHRRQPADGGDDRPGGRRRRLHRPGHARGQDRASSAQQQAEGHLVAMTGDGTNDAPAARPVRRRPGDEQRHVGGKEAANMVDLDSDPTKLLEVIAIGKQLLITRGSITTFSIANDVAKYFAILPALFVSVYPELGALNVMGLATPQSAILSAVIFNALIIIALIPLALRGVGFRAGAGQRAAPAQPPHLRPRRDHRPVHRDQGDRPRRGRPPPRVGNVQ